jgi:PleD family two-component response regulator
MAGELVLIIEDNEKNRKLVRDVLNVKGYKTIESETAEEGLKLATENLPSLILIVQFFFNETKSSQQLSRFRLWDSRSENPMVAVENGRHICPRINATRLIHILGTP